VRPSGRDADPLSIVRPPGSPSACATRQISDLQAGRDTSPTADAPAATSPAIAHASAMWATWRATPSRCGRWFVKRISWLTRYEVAAGKGCGIADDSNIAAEAIAAVQAGGDVRRCHDTRTHAHMQTRKKPADGRPADPDG